MTRPIKYKLPTGEIVTLYTAGVLAKALGKTTQAIQKLEWSNTLPKTPFKNKQGHRLYTQDQIDLVVRQVQNSNKVGASLLKYPREEIRREHDALLIKYGIKKKET